MQVIKIGLIGCGAVTLKAHLPALFNDPRAAISTYSYLITAVSDLNENNIAYISGILPHVAVYRDYQDLLSSADCEAVLIATGEHMHPQIAMEALKIGKYVLCEKPFAASYEELLAFKASSDQIQSDRLQIAFNKRFYPNYLRYQALTSESRFGVNTMGMFYFYTQQGKKPGWDGILSNLIHYCDLISSVFGEMHEVYTICSDVPTSGPDGISLTATMKSVKGAAVSLVFSSAASWKYSWHEEWQLLDAERNRLVCRNSTSLQLDYANGDRFYEDSSNSVFWMPDAHGYKSQLKSFYDLATGTIAKPLVNINDAVVAHKLYNMIKSQVK